MSSEWITVVRLAWLGKRHLASTATNVCPTLGMMAYLASQMALQQGKNYMKTAIVTGAARGIGLATSRLFVERGYRVALVDRDSAALDAACVTFDGVGAVA